MTKLEMYNKKYGKEDRKRCSYYGEDYIYINNFKARFYFTLVMIFIMGVGTLKTITTNIVIPESLGEFMKVYVAPYFIPWIIGCIFFTLLSAWKNSKKYKVSQRRLKNYDKILQELDEYEDSKEGGLNEYY